MLFLVNAIVMGFAVVILEATFSAAAFARPRHTGMLASLAGVVNWIAVGWCVLRLIEVAVAGKLALVLTPKGMLFLAEVVLMLAGAAVLWSPARRARPMWQVRAAILFILGGALFRVNTYMVAFNPGPNYSYFPALPELLITFGLIASEIAVYIAAVKTFPILSGAAPAAARG
jgi:Ni/Fe-hydrogenase subunit HybB-like protein